MAGLVLLWSPTEKRRCGRPSLTLKKVVEEDIGLGGAELSSVMRFVAARWVPETKQRIRFSLTILKNLGMKAGPGSIEEKLRGEASCLRNSLAAYEEMPFDALNDISDAVANVISGMAFGKCYDYGDETFRDLVDAMHKVVDGLGSGQIISVFPFLRFVPGINSGFMEVLKQSTKIQEVVWDEITRHRENLDRENPRDFLDFCLLEVEKQEKVEGLTEENAVYIAMELFMAGIGKTTNTLLWSLMYMTLNPDIQNKVGKSCKVPFPKAQRRATVSIEPGTSRFRVQRSNPGNITTHILQGVSNGRRSRGKPRRSWGDDVRDWMGMPLAECSHRARDRREWRRLILDSTIVPDPQT
ncbi:cytochrome P450 2 sub U member 1 [Branchiostoma belcheri]|nr:cytochrome P450 2 sub U member 1 [Branchiostoma belcheri]